MITSHPAGCVLDLRVQPGARTARVVGAHGAALKVAVTAPPVDGRANDDVIALVARLAGVPRRDVELVTGATSRSKRVLVRGVDAATLSAAVEALLGDRHGDG